MRGSGELSVGRLRALCQHARARVARDDGKWRSETSSEAVRLVPVADFGEAAYRLQHAIRDGLMSLPHLSPGSRGPVAMALEKLGLALGLEADAASASRDRNGQRPYWMDRE